jgi:hypothetical protein
MRLEQIEEIAKHWSLVYDRRRALAEADDLSPPMDDREQLASAVLLLLPALQAALRHRNVIALIPRPTDEDVRFASAIDSLRREMGGV